MAASGIATSRSRSIRTLRVLFLVAFLGSLAGIGGLLWFGRAGDERDRTGATAAASSPAAARPDAADIAIEGESFRQAVTQEERVLFQIEGGRYRADRSSNVFLEDVTITVAREEGDWRLRGETGRFNRDSKEARLEGEVSVAGPNGFSVATRWLELRQGGKVLVASRGTRFALGDSLTGESEHLRMDLEREVTVLSDGVVVRGAGDEDRPPFDLASERVVFDRASHRVDAEGDVRLRSESAALDSRRLTVQLDPTDRLVVGLRALWNVGGWLRRAPGLRGAAGARPGEAPAAPSAIERLAFQGTTLAVDFDTAQRPVRLQLEGTSDAPATLETAEAGGISHRVRANEVTGAFTDGELGSVLARRPVEIEERLNGELQTVGRARRALAAFDDQGRMVRVDLEEQVALVGQDLTANGDRASLLLLEETATFWGEPVRMQRGADALSAPEVVHRAKTGTLDARGGVRATMAPREGDMLGSAALGGGEGPVMVESSEATFRQAEDDVAFRGGVRAWRGTSLLLADQLRGDRGGRSLAASGTVRTAWRPEAAATAPGAGSTEASESSGGDEAHRRQPVEIAADHLTYQESERRLRYEGSVSVVQGAQTVTCQLLIIELDAEQQPESYDCSGQAKVVDRALERTVEGRQVVYQPGGGEVEVSGEPVRLVDPKLRVEGPKLWYSVEDGSVRMGPPATPPDLPPTDGTPSETGQ